jgi:hypothetical protein
MSAADRCGLGWWKGRLAVFVSETASTVHVTPLAGLAEDSAVGSSPSASTRITVGRGTVLSVRASTGRADRRWAPWACVTGEADGAEHVTLFHGRHHIGTAALALSPPLSRRPRRLLAVCYCAAVVGSSGADVHLVLSSHHALGGAPGSSAVTTVPIRLARSPGELDSAELLQSSLSLVRGEHGCELIACVVTTEAAYIGGCRISFECSVSQLELAHIGSKPRPAGCFGACLLPVAHEFAALRGKGRIFAGESAAPFEVAATVKVPEVHEGRLLEAEILGLRRVACVGAATVTMLDLEEAVRIGAPTTLLPPGPVLHVGISTDALIVLYGADEGTIRYRSVPHHVTAKPADEADEEEEEGESDEEHNDSEEYARPSSASGACVRGTDAGSAPQQHSERPADSTEASAVAAHSVQEDGEPEVVRGDVRGGDHHEPDPEIIETQPPQEEHNATAHDPMTI